MANIDSAKKRVRKTKAQSARNEDHRVKMHMLEKQLQRSTPEELKALVPEMQSAFAKAAKRGVIHKKALARKQRRMMQNSVK